MLIVLSFIDKHRDCPRKIILLVISLLYFILVIILINELMHEFRISLLVQDIDLISRFTFFSSSAVVI